MQNVEVFLPAMGEGITDATITRWLVAIGTAVSEDQPLVEIATDKVDSEVPSPVTGVVKQLLFTEGHVAKVGDALLVIETAESEPKINAESKKQPEAKLEDKEPLLHKKAAHQSNESKYSGVGLSPLVLSIAKREGIGGDELKQIEGTGLNQRITRDDILLYLSSKSKVIETQKPVSVNPAKTSAEGLAFEVVPMDRMRKLIAQHMVHSIQTSAHVTSFIEVDVTSIVNWRNSIKESFQKREGQKLTLTPIFIEAVAKTVRNFPGINSSVEGDNLIVKRNINIGIAAALPNGNLIVPVVKDADKLSIAGLANQVNDLSARAKQNKLNPDEIQGGTFTITNLGMFDTLTGTPIINQPQVAILAIGAIVKRVVVVETQQGDTIAIRSMAVLSLSYDHRVVDGALAGMFLKSLRDMLQNSTPNY
jgi:2-oxoglutarate dehydrogenase E2 component (dihydrolipoamide succinyltransferase)